jgi:ribosomal protein S3
MKIDLSKSAVVKLVTKLGAKRCKRVSSTRATEKNSTTSGTIAPEVWIMSGLLLSLAAQIVAVNLPRKQEEKQGTKNVAYPSE